MMHSGRFLLAPVPPLLERQHETVKDVSEGREVWGGSWLRQQSGSDEAAENEVANHENRQPASPHIKPYSWSM